MRGSADPKARWTQDKAWTTTSLATRSGDIKDFMGRLPDYYFSSRYAVMRHTLPNSLFLLQRIYVVATICTKYLSLTCLWMPRWTRGLEIQLQ